MTRTNVEIICDLLKIAKDYEWSSIKNISGSIRPAIYVSCCPECKGVEPEDDPNENNEDCKHKVNCRLSNLILETELMLSGNNRNNDTIVYDHQCEDGDCQDNISHLEKEAVKEYNLVVGKTILVSLIDCYANCDSVQIKFNPPKRFMIVNTDISDICRWNDDWLDPIWDVKPLEDISPDFRSFWVYGTSYSVRGEKESSSDWSFENEY